MAVTFNQNSVAPDTISHGVSRQRLLTAERVPGTKVLLDRLTLEPGSRLELSVPETSLAWFQVLEGVTLLRGQRDPVELGDSHIVFLPPRFKGILSAQRAAVVLYAEVPEASRFDPALTAQPSGP